MVAVRSGNSSLLGYCFRFVFLFLFIFSANTPYSSAESVSVSGAKRKSVNLVETLRPLPGPSVKPGAGLNGTINEKRNKGVSAGRAEAPLKKKLKTAPSGRHITLNFEAAPIGEVIKNICELLGINYIIESGVKGVVTIRTLNQIPLSNALTLLDQLLIINNLTRVKIGKYWRFLPAGKAVTEPLPVYMDAPATRFVAEERFQIQILTFNYISAKQVGDILKPFLSKNGSIKILARSNMVILVERGVKLVEVLDLVRALDVDSLDTMQVKLFELDNAFANEVVMELNSIYSAMGYISKEPDTGITFLPLERINGVLMVNPFPNLYPSIDSWVSRLDAGPGETEEITTFIYKVQNGDAVALAQILEQLYSDGRGGLSTASSTAKRKGEAKRQARTGTTAVPFEGSLQIIAYKDTNSIIIRTSRRNYPGILDTLSRLDEMPQQVLIEVLITELTLSDSFEFGFEWAMRSEAGKAYGALNSGGLRSTGDTGSVAGNLRTSAFNPVGNATGLSFFTRPSDNVMAVLRTLAEDSVLDVQASPILMTSNNKPASIDITNEVPISTTSESQGGTITQNIRYKSVGIRLSVTPKINEDKFVSLDINQEISQIDDTRTAQFVDAVPLLRRQAKTSVVVKDKQTLIIGGMINKQKGNSNAGVPFVSKIPIIGWFFSSKKTSENKTEILIFITPHVVSSPEDGKNITEEFQKKIQNLKMTVKAGKGKLLVNKIKRSKENLKEKPVM